MWGKYQLVVILSRTKIANNSIFVSNKSDTLDELKFVLMKKGQWCEYMDHIIELVKVDYTQSETKKGAQLRRQIMSQEEFPLRIQDISLPQCRTG